MLPAGALRRDLIALVALTFLYPALMALAFLPTPSDDLREHINWGLQFPLSTWKLPPLQSWIAGVVALTGVRDAWLYLLVAQTLNLVALFYLYRIARDFIAPDRTIPIVIAYCLTIYSSIAVLDSALNADQIQAPLWLGLLYHLLRAAHDDRWLDWLACAAYAALAVLAKYFGFLFFAALGAALLLTPATRPIIGKAKLYLAVAIAIVVIAPHLVATWQDLGTLGYGLNTIELGRRVSLRVATFGELLATIAYAAPLGAVAILVARQLHWVPRPLAAAPRVIVLTTAILLAILLALIFTIGFRYRYRYGAPIFPLLLLSLSCFVRIDPAALGRLARYALVVWGLIFAGSIAWALATPAFKLREPADAAAVALRAEWNRRYSCGPAYVLGQQKSAHIVGLYYGPPVLGVSKDDYTRAHWIDRELLRRLGGILVSTPEPPPTQFFLHEFPNATAPETIALPFRRTWNGPQKVYLYRFIPPQGC